MEKKKKKGKSDASPSFPIVTTLSYFPQVHINYENLN